MQEFTYEKNKIYLADENNKQIAVITFYEEGENVIVVDSTFVDEQLRGQGIAFRLVEAVVEYARKNNLKIVPVCPYVVKVLTRTEEYRDVLK